MRTDRRPTCHPTPNRTNDLDETTCNQNVSYHNETDNNAPNDGCENEFLNKELDTAISHVLEKCLDGRLESLWLGGGHIPIWVVCDISEGEPPEC